MEILKVKEWLDQTQSGAQFIIISRLEGEIDFIERIEDEARLRKFAKYDLGSIAGFSSVIFVFTEFCEDCIHVKYSSFYYVKVKGEEKCISISHNDCSEINDITDTLKTAPIRNDYLSEEVNYDQKKS